MATDVQFYLEAGSQAEEIGNQPPISCLIMLRGVWKEEV